MIDRGNKTYAKLKNDKEYSISANAIKKSIDEHRENKKSVLNELSKMTIAEYKQYKKSRNPIDYNIRLMVNNKLRASDVITRLRRYSINQFDYNTNFAAKFVKNKHYNDKNTKNALSGLRTLAAYNVAANTADHVHVH